jgi:hypothetical protein
MGKLIAACLLTGCLGLEVWAQVPSAQPATSQTPVTDPQTTSNSTTSDVSPLDKFKEFSAIMVGGPLAGLQDPSHIYRSGDLMRMEANQGNIFHVTDLVKQDTYGITKRGCLKYKGPYARAYPFSFTQPGNKYEITPVGKETVDGHPTQVVDLTISFTKVPNPIKIRMWEADDLQGFPIKIETKLHRTILYSNVVLGPQDPTLFIVPDQCQNGINQSQPNKAPAAKSPAKSPPKSQ